MAGLESDSLSAAIAAIVGEGVDVATRVITRAKDQIRISVFARLHRMGVPDEDIEDILSEVLLNVYQRIQRAGFPQGKCLSRQLDVYVYQAIGNPFRAYIRRNNKDREMLVPFSRYDEDSTAEHADLAKDEASRELRVAIAECAKELKPEQRLVIMLASEDYKPKDISRATKWKKRVVEGLLYRGRNAMRACLERKGVMES